MSKAHLAACVYIKCKVCEYVADVCLVIPTEFLLHSLWCLQMKPSATTGSQHANDIDLLVLDELVSTECNCISVAECSQGHLQ